MIDIVRAIHFPFVYVAFLCVSLSVGKCAAECVMVGEFVVLCVGVCAFACVYVHLYVCVCDV